MELIYENKEDSILHMAEKLVDLAKKANALAAKDVKAVELSVSECKLFIRQRPGVYVEKATGFFRDTFDWNLSFDPPKVFVAGIPLMACAEFVEGMGSD